MTEIFSGCIESQEDIFLISAAYEFISDEGSMRSDHDNYGMLWGVRFHFQRTVCSIGVLYKSELKKSGSTVE